MHLVAGRNMYIYLLDNNDGNHYVSAGSLRNMMHCEVRS
jgi:hypothetical protein